MSAYWKVLVTWIVTRYVLKIGFFAQNLWWYIRAEGFLIWYVSNYKTIDRNRFSCAWNAQIRDLNLKYIVSIYLQIFDLIYLIEYKNGYCYIFIIDDYLHPNSWCTHSYRLIFTQLDWTYNYDNAHLIWPLDILESTGVQAHRHAIILWSPGVKNCIKTIIRSLMNMNMTLLRCSRYTSIGTNYIRAYSILTLAFTAQ